MKQEENRLVNGFVDLFFLACSFGMFFFAVYLTGVLFTHG